MMMIRKNIIVTAAAAITIFSFGCDSANKNQAAKEKDITHLNFTVEEAPEWSSLFIRNHGWLGGDGIFATTMDGNEQYNAAEKSDVMFIFSDTQLGEVAGDSLSRNQVVPNLIHNSVGFLHGGKPDSTSADYYWPKDANGKPVSLFVPNTPASTKEDYYWLGDMFTNTAKNNDIYLFGYRVKSTIDNPGFSFKVTGNTLIHIPAGGKKPDFTNMKQMDIPFYLGRDVDSVGCFGAGILVNTKEAGETNADGYVYIYGVNKGQVIVSRTLPQDIEQFDKWTFWNGKDWVSDAYAVKSVADHASNELSVSSLGDGRYIMVFQVDGITNNVGIRLGASPVGPFGPVINIYDTKNAIKDSKAMFSYNAKAHPVISKPGELLITFNVNSTDYFNDIVKFPHLYRPRFIKLKYELDK